MKVGILTKCFNTFYSNGCNQQGFYLYTCLIQSPLITCYMFDQDISNDDAIFGVKLLSVDNNVEILQNLDAIITVSGAIKTEILLSCEKPVKINYICGNMYKIYQEQFIFGVHNYVQPIDRNYLYDIVWTIPNYKNNLDFLTYIHKKQIKIETVPYIWDTKLIDSACSANKTLFYEPNSEKSHTKFILIAEPNLQTTKTSLIPLMICDELYKNMKNIRIILLCKKSHENSTKVISRMSIYKSGMIDMYDRLQFTSVINDLKQQKKDFVVLSHQHDNPMNYLHLETLYLGYPLIHNVKELNSAGYYYETIKDGVNQISYAFNYHNKRIGEYKRHATYELHKYSPTNYDNCLKYTALLKNSHHYNSNKPISEFPLHLYNGMKLVLCYNKNLAQELRKTFLQPHYLFFTSKGYLVEIKEMSDNELFEETALHFIYGYHLFDKLPLKYIICQTGQSHSKSETLNDFIQKYYLNAEAILALSTKQLPLLKRIKDEVYRFPDISRITLTKDITNSVIIDKRVNRRAEIIVGKH